jgi:hypothetical protein
MRLAEKLDWKGFMIGINMCVMFMLEGRHVALERLQYGWSPI